jgi:hypothetical protein
VVRKTSLTENDLAISLERQFIAESATLELKIFDFINFFPPSGFVFVAKRAAGDRASPLLIALGQGDCFTATL